MVNLTTTKKCNHCHETKPVSEFHKNKRYDDGLQKRCRQCCSKLATKWREKHHDKYLETKRQQYLNNKKKHSAACAKWARENREKRREIVARHAAKPEIKKLRAYRQKKREETKRNAMPAWADESAIKSIYTSCPDGWHVDHVIPLKGKNVCGLHVENNLQHLPAKENCSKGNRMVA